MEGSYRVLEALGPRTGVIGSRCREGARDPGEGLSGIGGRGHLGAGLGLGKEEARNPNSRGLAKLSHSAFLVTDCVIMRRAPIDAHP